MTLRELLGSAVEQLRRAGIPEAELDARILLEAVTGRNRAGIVLDADKNVARDDQNVYFDYLKRRKRREPLAYILGEQEFWSLPFTVSPDVLIPRPETEFLLDRVLSLSRRENLEQGNILDLCCGSGVIAIVLALETAKKVFASDISEKAMALTKCNIRRHNLCGKVVQVVADLLTPFAEKQSFSLIVSNPPYVKSGDVLDKLQPEVADFEPHLALDGGISGLDMIKKIHSQLTGILCPGGQFFMEIGADQGTAVTSLFCSTQFKKVEILKDYAGRDRVLHAVKNVI
jgi:release factor glutamine methyltransferase